MYFVLSSRKLDKIRCFSGNFARVSAKKYASFNDLSKCKTSFDAHQFFIDFAKETLRAKFDSSFAKNNPQT